jgi:hypothetical protein
VAADEAILNNVYKKIQKIPFNVLDKKNQIADQIFSNKLNHLTFSDELFLQGQIHRAPTPSPLF